jgi:hypothetical protein
VSRAAPLRRRASTGTRTFLARLHLPEASMRNHVLVWIFGAALLAACSPDDGAAAAAAAAKGGGGHDRGRGEDEVLGFERLAGVPRPFAGPAAAENAIRGVPGGGLPWVIEKGEAKLREDGLLVVEVEGLVFDPDDPVVVERGLANRNTVPGFKAILSCRTVQLVDGTPVAAVVNVETAVFPATQGLAKEGGGDALIEQVVAPPSPCIAPIVFVTSPAGAWFAASGM